MIHRVLKIGSWVVDFLFAESRYDTEGVLACLYDARAPKHIRDEAKQFMDEQEMNTGFTYANRKRHCAVVVIGPTSSGREFVDTLVHETYHLAVAIADELGVDLLGETPAYLLGDITREFVGTICELGCSHR